jgi:DNA-binding GntR family transcriptional regulator
MTAYSDLAYKRLKSMIYDGALGPGDRLVERTLARELGVSRIPVREGLARLESEGLVRSVPNSATYVEDFAASDVREIYSMRLLLEPFSARLIAQKPSKKLVLALRKLCEKICLHQRAGEEAKQNEADYQFHHAIVRATEHGRLIRAYEGSHIRIMGLRAEYFKTRQAYAVAEKQHARLVDAIERGAAADAERIARIHIERGIRYIERALDAAGWGSGRSDAAR